MCRICSLGRVFDNELSIGTSGFGLYLGVVAVAVFEMSVRLSSEVRIRNLCRVYVFVHPKSFVRCGQSGNAV